MNFPRTPSKEENDRAAALRKMKKESARELFESLEDILSEYVDRHDNSETAIKARAVIAKAKQLTKQP